MRFLAASLVLTGLLGCDGVHHVDSRYATPERTMATLLASYGLADKSLAEVQSLRRTGRVHVRDVAARQSCFERFDTAEDEAMAGYVVAVLAEADGSARPTLTAGTARVAIGDSATIVLHDHEGSWRIDLPASVPVTTREAIHQAVMRTGNEHR